MAWLNPSTWWYWTVSHGVTVSNHLTLLDNLSWWNDFTSHYWTPSLNMLLDSFICGYCTMSPQFTGKSHLLTGWNDFKRHYWTALPYVIGHFHLAILNHITWYYWTSTVSSKVPGQFHLALLDRIIWRHWTVSTGVTEPYHLMLLNSFPWYYWTCWTVSLALLKHITWRNKTAIELFNMQR